MRDGIAAKPQNWMNCVMWVQDIVSPELNITAEMSTEDANNFVKLCRMLYSHVPEFDRVNTSSVVSNGKIALSNEIKILDLIDKEVADICQTSHLEFRKGLEVEIISTLAKYIKQFDASLEIHLFGSSHYGIEDSKTNLNLLIETRM